MNVCWKSSSVNKMRQKNNVSDNWANSEILSCFIHFNAPEHI